jgi:ABC-2 type transport system ATP-binding protein
MNVIEINDLTKFYGKSRGIQDVTLSVQQGEIFGFIGPNGAGKSTTIRLLLSLIFPTSGSATIFGQDINQHGPQIRARVGYLPSEVFYYERMKVRDLLNYAASFYPGDHTARITELAQLMELDMNRKIQDLSYGNKKKVGIVQGLLHKPDLIILDEPTSGLDPLMQQRFFDLLKRENERGATVFFSSHILGEVQRLCNRVAIIRAGSIVETQDIKTLRKNQYKKVSVMGENLSLNHFQMDGVTNIAQLDGTLSFLFKGDVNQLTARISQATIADVVIEEPSLEEIFMHYYEN